MLQQFASVDVRPPLTYGDILPVVKTLKDKMVGLPVTVVYGTAYIIHPCVLHLCRSSRSTPYILCYPLQASCETAIDNLKRQSLDIFEGTDSGIVSVEHSDSELPSLN